MRPTADCIFMLLSAGSVTANRLKAMYRVYACLTQEHDLLLVAAGICTCFFASFTALSLIHRALAAQEGARGTWLAASAFTTGSGVWATHFVAMLAFDTGLPTGYDIGFTILSLVLAVLVTGMGFAIPLFFSGLVSQELGGAVIGLGVGIMHYTGMIGLRIPAEVSWDMTLVALSLLLGVALAAIALKVSFNRAWFGPRLQGGLLLTAAICSLHFTGMGAVQLSPDPLLPLPEMILSRRLLAIAVVAVALTMVAFCLAGSMVDERIARLKADEARRLQELANATLEGICIHSDDRILDANTALARLLGLDVKALIGRSIWEFVPTESRTAVLHHVSAGSIDRYESEILRSDGRLVPVEVSGRSIDYLGKPARVAAVHDITQRKRVEARMRHMALHDALTNLPNRVLFADRLELALARAQRTGERLAVICLDLDRFKEINDVHGHAMGDRLLQEVTNRLVDATRNMDTVARLGGDEFAIIQPALQNSGGAVELARRLISKLSLPFEIDGKLLRTGASIGLALYPRDGQESATLLQLADLALYRAKAEGRGTYRLFEREMEAVIRDRRVIEHDLRIALSGERLELHYQPQVNTKSGAIEGFEALVRWLHPARGQIPPDQFIPIAEDTGLILPLGEWALRQACADAASWPEHLVVSVNLSPVQFGQENLPHLIAEVLRDTGLRADRLELEITETVLIKDRKRASRLLRGIKALGVRIAMDDFGTGFSSLSHLRDFPFDKIKIDKSFIHHLDRPDAVAIVQAIIGLGQSLQVAVVAEGVETAQTGEFLRRHGCYLIQGYLIAKPMPIRQWRALQRGRRHRRPSPETPRHAPMPPAPSRLAAMAPAE